MSERVRLTTQPTEETSNPEHPLQIFERMDAKDIVMFSSEDPEVALPLRGELKERSRWRDAAGLHHLGGEGR